MSNPFSISLNKGLCEIIQKYPIGYLFSVADIYCKIVEDGSYGNARSLPLWKYRQALNNIFKIGKINRVRREKGTKYDYLYSR